MEQFTRTPTLRIPQNEKPHVSNQIANIGLYKEVISRVFIDGSKINSNKSCAKFDYDYQAYGIDCSENSFLCENIIEFCQNLPLALD